jgi:hypothetical protein
VVAHGRLKEREGARSEFVGFEEGELVFAGSFVSGMRVLGVFGWVCDVRELAARLAQEFSVNSSACEFGALHYM